MSGPNEIRPYDLQPGQWIFITGYDLDKRKISPGPFLVNSRWAPDWMDKCRCNLIDFQGNSHVYKDRMGSFDGLYLPHNFKFLQIREETYVVILSSLSA